MTLSRDIRRLVAGFGALLIVATLAMTNTGVAQPVPSSVDTMRIVDAQAAVGDTVEIDFHLRNVDTLGAYVFRVRYDPTLIEPLTDTVYQNSDTFHVAEVMQLRGTAFEQFQGGVPQPGVLAFVAVDLDADTLDLFLPGTGSAARMRWHVLPTATPQTIAIVFEQDPDFPESHNNMVDLWGDIFKSPVLVNGIFNIEGGGCDCPFQADTEPDGFLTAIDMSVLIDILFAGRPDIQDPACVTSRFDLDCDGVATAIDLGLLTDHLFAGGAAPCDPCVN